LKFLISAPFYLFGKIPQIASGVCMKLRYAFVLLLALLMTTIGCGVVRTGPFGETAFILIPSSQEVLIGRSVARQVERKYRILQDPVIEKYVSYVGQRIASVCDRHDIKYSYKVIDSDELNAFSLPGGFVYIYRGLLEKLDNEAELAFVLGHETGHIVGRHAIKNLQMAYGANILLSLAFKGSSPTPLEAQVIKLVYSMAMNGYSRKEEFEADAMGAYYAGKAGWNPVASIEVIKKLDALAKFKPSGFSELFMDHPTNRKRIENLNSWISTFPKSWLSNPFNEKSYRENVLRRLKEIGKSPSSS